MAVSPDNHGQIRSNMTFKLTISDHFEVCQSLKDLGSPNTHRRLGGALGLLYPTLQKMTSFPDEVVAAWLNRQDEVIQNSGEPTWSTLEDALRKTGQTGLAENVKHKTSDKGMHYVTSHTSSGDHSSARLNSSTQTDSEIPAAQLSEETREDLYQQVVRDTRRIKLKFSALQDEIWKSIKDIQELVQLVLGMGILSKEDEEQIRKTPSAVTIILVKYWSFLDFENLEHIVERKCGSAEKRMIKEYKEEVEIYCRRRVSELPPKSLGSSSNNINTGMKKLCILLALDDPALQSIRHLKMAIANILGCRTSDLVLQNVETGSVLATYLVTATVGAQLVERRITDKQKAALKVNKVMWIRYDEKITIFEFSAHLDSSIRQMSTSRWQIDVDKYWTPWEHEVCKQCFEDNPNAIWLVMVTCLKPHRHIPNFIRVVIDHKRMAMVSLRRVSTGLWRIARFKPCHKGESCGRKLRCWFPHGQHEVDMWNIKSRLIKGKGTGRMLVSQLCDASLKSQCPSEVCRACYEANPRALWLAWLKCINTERHQNPSTVTVVVGKDKTQTRSGREKRLLIVRSLPSTYTQLDQVRLCVSGREGCSCLRAHSEEEMLYWKWQVARNIIFSKYPDYLLLNKQYEYPSEASAVIASGIAEKLSESNYQQKYHKLVYLEELESSQRIIAECDTDDVMVSIEWSPEEFKYIGYLMKLSYTAMHYASYNRAEAVITFDNDGQSYTTSILETPDYDKAALVLRIFPSNRLIPPKQVAYKFKGSVHFEISHHHFHHQHQAIENASESTISKLFPSSHTLRQSQSGMEIASLRVTDAFHLDQQYQLKALKQMFSCSPSAPYILLGPFGTGKTYLLSAAVSKLMERGTNKVLVCTHRNRGADGIYRALQGNVRRVERHIARVVGGAEAAERLRLPGATIVYPDRQATNYSVLITTFGVAGNLIDLVRQGYLHFSHILIDEGAQCPEPEALGALILAERDTRVIIVGDNKQVGPKVRVFSEKARDNGLGESILERLFSHYKVKSHLSLVKSHTSTLLTNYRCHPSILMLASSLFYEYTLLSQTKRETHPKAPYPLVFSCTSVNQNSYSDCHPENEEEAKLLIDKLVEFIRTWINPPKEQIGVLASTKQQVACLRKHWQRKKLFVLRELRKIKVTILPTYNIQGEEFSAVFLSTAEPTNGQGAPVDHFKSICNEYVFNTIITRPQSLIFAVGNPFTLLQMGSHFETNCWMEYIRRCIQCQSIIPPPILSTAEAQQLPKLMGNISEKVLLSETIQQDENSEGLDGIVERYITDLKERGEYKLAGTLVQSPSGDMSWVRTSSRKGVVLCKLDSKDLHNTIARPVDPNSNQEAIKLASTGVLGRRGAFHGTVVKVDTIRKCVLFDEETERALVNTHFGTSFPCRVDPKNPIMFFPLDRRYPKFVNLPMLLVKDKNGVVCFDPKTINGTPKMSNFIPLEVAAKTLFIVKFLGWQSRFPYPLGIIIAALPPGHSPYTGELVLRISNNIPLVPCTAQTSLPRAQSDRNIHSYDGAFTIDPKDSPDHDDALTCRLVGTSKEGDTYEIGVHIVNVQHYIPKGSELDKEARKRGHAAYRASDVCVSYMLPEKMVRDILSISEGRSTRTLSVTAQYKISKDNIVEGVPNSTKIEDSKTVCSLQLTYEEAQKILCRELNYRNDPLFSAGGKIDHYNKTRPGIGLKIEDQLSTIWRVAMSIRQKRLGRDAAYSLPLDEPEKLKCPEAHHLIEELMIWANCQVATRLLNTFPDFTILRVQGKPQEGEVAKLQSEHGPTLATSLSLQSYAPQGVLPVTTVNILRDTYQKIKSYLERALVRNALHYVQFEQLHPQMAVAVVGLRQCERSAKSDYIVSTADRTDYSHNDLRCELYTHFTSPIRRYIDIVVQRLLHAAIHGERCPYTSDELNEICAETREGMKHSKGYRKDIGRLDLATNLNGVSKEYICFVQRITEDGEIELTFSDPLLKVLHERERLIALKHLNALSIPSTRGREISPVASSAAVPSPPSNSPQPSTDGSVMWQVKVASFKGSLKSFLSSPEIKIVAAESSSNRNRCAEISLFVPESYVVSEQSTLKEHKLNAEIIPYTHSVPQSLWKKLQEYSKVDMSRLRSPDSLADNLLKALGSQTLSNSSIVPAVAYSPSPLLIYKLHRPIKPSEVLKVHLTASPLNYILAPNLQLVEVGPELKICVQHNSNPSECFADRLVEDASKKRYSSIEEYFRCWEQVLLSEAVIESLSESELLIVKDVTLKWPELESECDSFGQVTYKLNIPPGEKEAGVVMELPDNFLRMSYEFFKFSIGDLLCIRYTVNHDGNTFGFTLHMVIHHAEIVYKNEERVSVIEKATFYLKFVGQSSNSITPKAAQVLQGRMAGVQCEVQLLPLTLPFRRVYKCLHDLRLKVGVSSTARRIALGTPGTQKNTLRISRILTQDELLLATSLWPLQLQNEYPGSRKLKELNAFQKEALDIAYGNSFTLIQGPPGTGKTVTGAHLAYVLANKLRKDQLSSKSPQLSAGSVKVEELRPCVMYCGPSNQAVNVVLNILTQHASPVKDKLKILRVFSKAIEQEQYPGPKLHDQVFRKYTTGADSKCESHHKPFALHERVRRVNPRIAEMDAEFKELHRQGKVASQAKRQEYYRLISGTEKMVLREKVDIVLCTCNEASSNRIKTTLKPVYCIVDECAMSTEPECMVPIQRADHVILIGDHQQLRPIIKNHTAEVKGLGTSLFERYVSPPENGDPLQKPYMLKLQYRMHPEICELPSQIFYEGKLKTDPSLMASRRSVPEAHLNNFWPRGEGKPFVFVDLVGEEGREHTGHRGKTKVGLESKFNKDEAKKIAAIASVLVARHKVAQKQIAALTPYSAQKEEIKKYLRTRNLSDITVKTVTESQGSEYGIVLLSTVRSKPLHEIRLGDGGRDQRKNADIGWIMKNLGFVTDSHQICVGITRCKYGLVIVGNRTLLKFNETWRNLIDHYEQNYCVIENASRFPRQT